MKTQISTFKSQMSNVVKILLIFMTLTSCSSRTDFRRIAFGDPIMPVMLNHDSTLIYITDYVPSLVEDGFDAIHINKHQFDPFAQTITIHTSDVKDPGRFKQVNSLTFERNGLHLEVPVLPALEHSFGLYTVKADPNFIYVRFEHQPKHVEWAVFWQNQHVKYNTAAPDEQGLYAIPIPKEAIKHPGRSFIRVYAVADNNFLFNDLLIPLQNGRPVHSARQLNRHDQQAQILYSLLVDRFQNGDPSNDWKLNSPEVLDIVDYQGGDFAGITQKIEDGFFDDLGINTIWISPITQNPWDAWGKYVFTKPNKYDPSKSYTRFSGYHGYWPIYATQTDSRFGSADEFRQLLETAHNHNINVILDYVANHMHINSPTYTQHPDWHTDSILPDGRRNFELWDEQRLTTWFDKHIPTLDLEREDICQAMTDSALFWLEHFELDGFRHDACKHIPESYWRLLGQKIATRFPDRPIWMIGETYGSPALIGSYVKTGQLNAQFDFNVYFAIRDALVNHQSFIDLNRTVIESLKAYGAHHTMGNISGNHDQIRFASMAGGAIGTNTNGKEEGWTSTVGIGNPELAYTRCLQQAALNLTLPGVPCFYQGDEYAETGGNDPDNRLMMKFDDQLSETQSAHKDAVCELIRLRRNSMPLLYGEYLPVEISDDKMVFDRVYMNERIHVIIIRDQLPIIEHIE